MHCASCCVWPGFACELRAWKIFPAASAYSLPITPQTSIPSLWCRNIPRRVALLAKKEVFRIPNPQQSLRLAKLVPVDRSDKEAAAESVDIAVEYLKEGLSFLVFPEGTRSRDGRLLPFKKGTFLMAIRAGAWVVPVSLAGTQRLMRKGDWTIHPGEVVVRYGPPSKRSVCGRPAR